ncbi:hypothetical protein LF296_13670 [Acinetobacter vivianii]|uniref:DUF4760 domain-containing protein n=1 Tax=Acinetobacter vivianii TaxID=1776742 RepID=N8V3I3_9GAMM|nr:hypothetical protein [Acinetobacter vivianii]ENU94155.1 hypothetical protein F971_00049 [Acinetobacter vivianii]WDZ50362.1 hypothetical protein LF296_13670 [Acinetobacter vivianii]
MKTKKEEVTLIFCSAFIFLCIGLCMYGIIFHIVAPYIFGNGYDKGALATMIGWSATLFIGYCGYILIDKWKDQEHKKIIRDNANIALNNLKKFMTLALAQSHIKELPMNDFRKFQEIYYDTYISLNVLSKLIKDPELDELENFFKNTYQDINEVRSQMIQNKITFIICEEEMRKLIVSLGVIYRKCARLMNIHNID